MIALADVLEPVTFSREIGGQMVDLVVPEEFIKDFHFTSDEHLMIIIRIIGGDAMKVRDFFEDTEGDVFRLQTVDANNQEMNDKFLLTDMHMDEGPSIRVDIDQEQALVRLILDFKRII